MLMLSKQKKEKVVKISTKKKRGTQGCKKWNNNHIYSGEKKKSIQQVLTMVKSCSEDGRQEQ